MLTRLATYCALMVWASLAGAQIVVPSKVQLGDEISASTPFEAKGYKWKSTAKLHVLPDGKSAFIWARPGRHSVTLTAVTEDYEIHEFNASFEVVDSPLPPTPVTLRELAGDDETAAKLAEYFKTIAGQIQPTTTAAKFWAGYEASFKVQVSTELDTALRARLTKALESLPTLADSLRAIAAEFEAQPEPTPVPPKPVPPVVEGKRKVLIAHESSDKSPWFGELTTELRKSGSNAEAYLKAHGHTLTILDDELIRESPTWSAIVGSKLDALPHLFIIDPQTNAILFEQVIANGTTADNITERIRETGG
mgnify:CR=1 FL=1